MAVGTETQPTPLTGQVWLSIAKDKLHAAFHSDARGLDDEIEWSSGPTVGLANGETRHDRHVLSGHNREEGIHRIGLEELS